MCDVSSRVRSHFTLTDPGIGSDFPVTLIRITQLPKVIDFLLMEVKPCPIPHVFLGSSSSSSSSCSSLTIGVRVMSGFLLL